MLEGIGGGLLPTISRPKPDKLSVNGTCGDGLLVTYRSTGKLIDSQEEYVARKPHGCFRGVIPAVDVADLHEDDLIGHGGHEKPLKAHVD